MSLWLPDTGEQIDHDALMGLSDDDHSAYLKITGETGAISFSPLEANDPAITYLLDTYTNGTLLSMKSSAAMTVDGALTGFLMDFNTNITDGDQAITAINILLPDSNSQSMNAIHARTYQEAGDILLLQHLGSTMAGDDEFRGVFIDFASLTINHASAEVYGIDMDLEDITFSDSGIFSGIRIRGPIAGDVAGDATIMRLQAGHDSPGIEYKIDFLDQNSIIMRTTLSTYPTGTIYETQFDTAETLTGALIGHYVDLTTNITPDGNTTDAFQALVPLNDENATSYLTASGGAFSIGLVRSGLFEQTTTDGAATPLLTFTIIAGRTYHFKAYVLAGEIDTQDVASYEISATIKDDGAGNAVILGQTSVHLAEVQAAWVAVFSVTGASLILSLDVTGEVAKNIRWSGYYEYLAQNILS